MTASTGTVPGADDFRPRQGMQLSPFSAVAPLRRYTTLRTVAALRDVGGRLGAVWVVGCRLVGYELMRYGLHMAEVGFPLLVSRDS